MPYVWEILNQITTRLFSVTNNPRFEAELLLSHALGITRANLLSKLRDCIDPPLSLNEFVSQRLQYKPLAYILGYTEFYSLIIFTEPPVFVPRPETEILVEKTIEIVENIPRDNLKVLELCTGTGCIPVALLKNTKKDIFIISTDISENAIRLAKKNISYHNVNVNLLLTDLFSAITPTPLFDIIVSNPPYVSEDEWKHLSPTIKEYEDKNAIVAGKDGLEVISKIVWGARLYLKKGGYLIFEIGENRKDDVLELLSKAGYVDAKVYDDLQFLPRVAIGKLE